MPFYFPFRGTVKPPHSLRLSVFLVAIAAVLILPIARALSHSWYPYECCSAVDCHPVAVEGVKVTREGYRLNDGSVIRFNEARPSPDGLYHECRTSAGTGDLIRLKDKPACFWAPMGAS